MIALLARLILGVLLLVASLDKLFEPVSFAQAIANYRLLTDWAIPLAALTMPWLELVVGLSLTLGCLTDSAALLATGLGLSFAAAQTSALVRGLDIECGCFGDSAHVSWTGLALDLAMAGLGLLLLWLGPGRWALDSAFRQKPAPEE